MENGGLLPQRSQSLNMQDYVHQESLCISQSNVIVKGVGRGLHLNSHSATEACLGACYNRKEEMIPFLAGGQLL